MIKQSWIVTIEEKDIMVDYSYSALSGKTKLVVDGDSYTVKGKPFGIGCARVEMILVGGEAGCLNIKKNGKAVLVCHEGEVHEIVK